MATRDDPRLQLQKMQNVRISYNPDFHTSEAYSEGVLVRPSKRPTGNQHPDQGVEDSMKFIKNVTDQENRSLDCLNEQIKVISVFYISYVILDLIMQIIVNKLIDKEIECQNHFVIIPTNNKGAGFFLAQNALVLSFTFMVLLVYFLIPDKYRLIVRF
jgi:hypothetical protein